MGSEVCRLGADCADNGIGVEAASGCSRCCQNFWAGQIKAAAWARMRIVASIFLRVGKVLLDSMFNPRIH
jgi:hypothetical protein